MFDKEDCYEDKVVSEKGKSCLKLTQYCEDDFDADPNLGDHLIIHRALEFSFVSVPVRWIGLALWRRRSLGSCRVRWPMP